MTISVPSNYQPHMDTAEVVAEQLRAVGVNVTIQPMEWGVWYEQVYKGQMVTAFNDWCFDAARKAGDTDIVETSYGYHIIYFIGQDLPYWQVRVTNTMKNNAMNTWLESLQQDYTITEGSGMKYVG